MPAAMSQAPARPEALRAAIAATFPLVAGAARIDAHDVRFTEAGAIEATLHAIAPTCETEGTAPLVPTHRTGDPRALAWWRATCEILRAWLARDDPGVPWPFELLFPEALEDMSLESSDDFAAALADSQRIAQWRDQRLRADVLRHLEPMGLADRLDALLALPRPVVLLEDATRIDPDDDDDGQTPIGATRLGGDPDLPPDLPWPTIDGAPLTFAAQLDLADLRRHPGARELPPDGLLAFFYEPFPEIGDDGVIAVGARVLHLPAGAALVRRAAPDGGDPRPEYSVEPRDGGEMMPPLEGPFYLSLLSDARIAGFFRDLREGARPLVDPLAGVPALLGEFGEWLDCQEAPQHRVLGHCRPFQGDVYLEAEAAAAGVPPPAMDRDDDIARLRAACRWRLLLQLSADGDDELLFNQDGGFVYFLIPADDLAAGRWDRVQCVTQFG